MAKLIKKYDSDYFVTSNEIFRDKRLSYKELGLLLQLLSLPNDWDFNIRGLSTLHKDGRSSVAETLKKLIEYGYLWRDSDKQTRNEKGLYDKLDYYIYDNPKNNPHYNLSGNQATDDIQSGNRDTDNPNTEIQAQYNNNQYNNNQYNSTSTNKPNLNDLFNVKQYELDGMLLTDKQYDDINELVQMIGCRVIDSSKDDLLRFLKKLYDKEKQTFIVNGSEEIYDLKSFVKGVFSRKTEHDTEEYKQIKNLANQGYDWAIDYVNENPKIFSNLK